MRDCPTRNFPPLPSAAITSVLQPPIIINKLFYFSHETRKREEIIQDFLSKEEYGTTTIFSKFPLNLELYPQEKDIKWVMGFP